jgi:glycosyltransferase involved in cell wall biosynthesis
MNRVFALLGFPDAPTDGVKDYCDFLGKALARRGVVLETVGMPAFGKGWIARLTEFLLQSQYWKGSIVLLQYTALGWSRRGFPVGALATLLVLRLRGIACGVVFHEYVSQSVPRKNWVHRPRGMVQDWVLRSLHRLATKSIFTVPLESVKWLPRYDSKSAFIPVGANVPDQDDVIPPPRSTGPFGKTVAVFCVSDPPFREQELIEIARAVRFVSVHEPDLRIVFLGKGTNEARAEIARQFDGANVRIVNLGLCELSEVARVLRASDAMLCVRGRLNLRRASALAGVACGVPILAYSGAAEGTILAEAGVELVSPEDNQALGSALSRILTDRTLWQTLHDRNLHAYQRHFSWDSIAASFIKALGE